ncbi:MAG: hypothetical protein PHC62_00920 [Candidatus Izemoplasmatales bacterium]|nr:hypothetical protein [Candidatus Izemoplasmatales bacterium]
MNELMLENFNFQMSMLEIDQDIINNELKNRFNINLNENIEIIQEGIIETFKNIMKKIIERIVGLIFKLINSIKDYNDSSNIDLHIKYCEDLIREKSRKQQKDGQKSVSLTLTNAFKDGNDVFMDIMKSTSIGIAIMEIKPIFEKMIKLASNPNHINNKQKESVERYAEEILQTLTNVNEGSKKKLFSDILKIYHLNYDGEETFDDLYNRMKNDYFNPEHSKEIEFKSPLDFKVYVETNKKAWSWCIANHSGVEFMLKAYEKKVKEIEQMVGKLPNGVENLGSALNKFTSSVSQLYNILGQFSTFACRFIVLNKLSIKRNVSLMHGALKKW